MFYKKITIIYIVLIALIFSLSFIRASKNMRQETQLALLRDYSLVIVIAFVVLAIILIAFKLFAKKK